MADSKITALTAISTVDPTADPLVIVDVSDTSMAASGTTKKSTINQLLGAGGTATLASATITGDLTVDTSTLKVDSANNRVGIGTASPLNALHVLGSTTGNVGRIVGGGSGQPLFLYSDNSGSGVNNGSNGSYGTGLYFSNASNFLAFYTDTGSGGTEKARIDSAGNVGIGVTPVNKLTIGTGSFNASTVSGSSSLYSTVAQGLVVLADGFVIATRAGVNRMVLDTSGNIISNVTSTAPSLTDNGFMVFNLTSNTNLRISVRGSDGVTRTANLTLA